MTKVAVIGCGQVSQVLYAPVLAAFQEAELVCVQALIDPQEQQLKSLKHFFPRAELYSSLNDFDPQSLDLAIVASPPNFHAEQSIWALNRGVAVLCEKPMALNSREASQMLEASKNANKILAVGHFRRFFPASQMLKSIFENRPFGELLSFSIEEGGKFAWGVSSSALFDPAKTPGGVLYDAGIHVIDLLLWWLGPPEHFHYEDDAMGGLEANFRLELSYPRGVRGVVNMSRDWPRANVYRFVFAGATVLYEVGQANKLALLVDGLPYVLGGELTRVDSANGIRQPTETSIQSFAAQLRNVIAAIKGEEPVQVPAAEAIHCLDFVEQCYAKRQLLQMPWFDREEQKAAELLASARA